MARRAFVAKAKPGWRKRAPMRKFSRRALMDRCGPRAFLDPTGMRFPVMQAPRGTAGCTYDCQGILAAYKRAGQYKHFDIQEDAIKLGKKLGCKWTVRAEKKLPKIQWKAEKRRRRVA